MGSCPDTDIDPKKDHQKPLAWWNYETKMSLIQHCLVVSDRTQSVWINGSISSPLTTRHGVPWGYIMGLCCFTNSIILVFRALANFPRYRQFSCCYFELSLAPSEISFVLINRWLWFCSTVSKSFLKFQFKRRTFSKFDVQKLIRYNEPFLIILVCNLYAVLS